MVATVASKNTSNQEDLIRPPLIPSEKDNAAVAVSRRPRAKEINSRYLSSSSSTSTSYSSSTTTTSSSSSSSARRFPSPLVSSRSQTPSALPQSRRSSSVDRTRPSSPRPVESSASRALCTTTRSLSVSFQGESFFYQTPKPTPERRRVSENSRPSEHHHRWPAAKPRASNPLARSLDYSLEEKNSILATVHLLQQSMDSDTDSVSSGSNSEAHDLIVPPRSRITPRGISVPARFLQETNSRLSSPGSKMVKKSLVDSPLSSPRSAASPLHGPVRQPSPSKFVNSPRGMASPLRTRSGSAASHSPVGQPANAPSIISFAVEVRRAKKGENRIEEAHILRLLDNRHLQWRCVNARANAALLVQTLTAEKNLYNAWITTLELRDSVTLKKKRLQLLKQNLKLISILKGQMSYLEEWSHVDRDHSNSLLGAIEALKASTLRLPVGGAKADIQEVKESVGSAVDVMQAMASSICSLLSKVEGTSSLVSELAKVAAQEQALLNQSRDLLSMVAAMHVKQCSLQGHILQLKRKSSQMQL
ncbi:QWRF motif-containing protein 2-like [Typha angustifolia]|uniref:QWRF motif-containing protein 2-like n=1 Tax=Typha angustifolia TaxID=59011 RepID=UPI003C2CE654